MEVGRIPAPGKDLMPTGPSLQVALGWHTKLQPRADHAERSSAPDQPGCQYHEGEAHLLRYAALWTGTGLPGVPQPSGHPGELLEGRTSPRDPQIPV